MCIYIVTLIQTVSDLVYFSRAWRTLCSFSAILIYQSLIMRVFFNRVTRSGVGVVLKYSISGSQMFLYELSGSKPCHGVGPMHTDRPDAVDLMSARVMCMQPSTRLEFYRGNWHGLDRKEDRGNISEQDFCHAYSRKDTAEDFVLSCDI
jgi:hypothetical protein